MKILDARDIQSVKTDIQSVKIEALLTGISELPTSNGSFVG